MSAQYENMVPKWTNIYPDYARSHNTNPVLDIIKLGYGYYALVFANGTRERVSEELAMEIAGEMNIKLKDRVN